METVREEALYSVKYRVKEDMLLRLERGTRVLGFQGGAKKFLSIFGVIALVCLAAKVFVDGTAEVIVSAIAGSAVLVVIAGSYALAKGWAGTKRDIRKKYNENKVEYQQEKECLFFEDHYEVISTNEHSRLDYKNIGRMLDMSGMMVLLEKGDIVRFFMTSDIKKGDAGELAAFLERKSGTSLEHVSVK